MLTMFILKGTIRRMLVQVVTYDFVIASLTAQEVLESLKDRWFQADNPPADQLLNEEEFLSFLHPEHSRGMLKYMVKEIVRDLGTVIPCHLWLCF